MTQPSAASVTPPGSPVDKPASLDPETNIKETIESILVAFILAFIFRAFVVEAFVIPTGSMAPTLLGAHMRYQCPDCGWVFDVNYSPPREEDSDDMRTPPEAFPPTDIYCPNCGYHIAGPQGPAAPVNYGDRILVLKYIYLLHPPQRWDVVVFKSPDEPQHEHYQVNFIKRLVGLPGEQLMVLDGNVYVRTSDTAKWEIPKKPRSAQEALWRVVYNNDFYPQAGRRPSGPQFVQPWKPEGAGWDLSGNRTFKFDSANGTGNLRFNMNANSTTQTLTDYLVYDAANPLRFPGMGRRPSPLGSPDDEIANRVSDLKLVANYTRTGGTGPFRLTLTKPVDVTHTFVAELTPEAVRLIHRTSTGELTTIEKNFTELGIRADKPIFIEFMNVDYRVTLRLNGQEVFPPLDYQPNVDWLIKQWQDHHKGWSGEAEISAENQTCILDHISLWRDVYYTNRDSQSQMDLHSAGPMNPVKLGPGEYFTMGDNSAISKDARYWTDPINLPDEGLNMAEGRVPEQFLLGKAVFVYWPAGYRAFDTRLAIIPNFGDMRWIH